MNCAHCNKGVVGEAFVFDDDEIVHVACRVPRERTRRGLVHQCPECHGSGKVPTGQRLTRDNPVGEWPHGGVYTVDAGPEMKPCDLCDGEGLLAKPPTPVVETRTVGWKR